MKTVFRLTQLRHRNYVRHYCNQKRWQIAVVNQQLKANHD